MGGEKHGAPASLMWSAGSPPRGRGKAGPQQLQGRFFGITPAWAGKRFWNRPWVWATSDHPRVGGEKNAGFTKTDIAAGSPPRGRGKDSGTVHGCGQLRITPAWAGKSREIPLHLRAAKDHPCVGGEKGTQGLKGQAWEGSPPHGRGKARHLSHGLLPCG